MSITVFHAKSRRGALLLLVLGMLSLFVLIGTVTLSLATRARTTSRAFAAATAGTAVGPMLARLQLEEAIFQLVRGGRDAKAAGLSESLLEDMYDEASAEAQVTAIFEHWPVSLAVVKAEASTLLPDETHPNPASTFLGRLMTFTPSADAGRAVRSARILGVGADQAADRLSCWIDTSAFPLSDSLTFLSLEAEKGTLSPGLSLGTSVSSTSVPGKYLNGDCATGFDTSSQKMVTWTFGVPPGDYRLTFRYRCFADGTFRGRIGTTEFTGTFSSSNHPFGDSFATCEAGNFPLEKGPTSLSLNLAKSGTSSADVICELDAVSLTKVCDVVVNPPAFRDEAHDAYDAENPWLTEISLKDGSVEAVPRPAFAAPGTAAEVDNDNDGVMDGVWLTGVLPSRPAAGGGRFEFDASYLVLDLDGRINVNAHGSRTSIDYPAAGGWWDGSADVPIGSGYGPADVDGSLIFVDQSTASPVGPPPASRIWRRLVSDTTAVATTPPASSATQRRPVAEVGRVDGRYGQLKHPGAMGNDRPSQRNELLYVTGTDASGKLLKNPLVDLPCAIKTLCVTPPTTGVSSRSPMPRMVHYRPTWSVSGSEYDDDPYEMRLDIRAPRPFDLRSGTAVADNPFTLTDLEAVLRQFDVDATTISQRLAVVLDTESQRSRMLITTDSWDTPCITGTVAAEVTAFMRSLRCPPAEVMSPDVLAGLRFDLNRPFTSGSNELASKQDFCKHLFTLLVALGQPADSTTAQWVANVVDFRDADSVFTRFQFDTTPTDGWNRPKSDGSSDPGWKPTNVVWGIERPEALIAQTIAFYVQGTDSTIIQDGLYISLYRPSWTEEQWQRGSNGKPALYKTLTASPLNLGEKPTGGSQPKWRLRIGGTATSGNDFGTIVRFDKPGSGEQEIAGVFRRTGGNADDSTLEPDSYLVVMPSPPRTTGPSKSTQPQVDVPVDSAFKKFEINSGGIFKAEHWPGAATYHQGADTIVFLERLEDPSKPWNDNAADPETYNPYVVLDRLGIKRVNRTGEGNNWKTYIRQTSLWKNGPFDHVDEAGIVTLDPAEKSWLPWANRPFVSQAELALVPQGGGAWRYWDNDLPKNKRATNPYYCLPTPKLLEAAIVSSRFAGSQVSVDPTSLSVVGMEKIPFNQLSRWREPGRVNLNTVVSNTGCAVPERDNAVWWAALGPDATVSLDQFRQAGPATNMADLLALKQEGGLFLDTESDVPNGNSWKKRRAYDLNPTDAYATAIRLANVATIRSHVFAVWVTLRVRDTSAGGSDSFHRAFAVIDRSRPVGYSEGRNLNTRDSIRVLRFLE